MLMTQAITITFDNAGQPIAACLQTENWDGSRSVTPWEPWPFDTPQEVWEAALDRLTVQLTLW